MTGRLKEGGELAQIAIHYGIEAELDAKIDESYERFKGMASLKKQKSSHALSIGV